MIHSAIHGWLGMMKLGGCKRTSKRIVRGVEVEVEVRIHSDAGARTK
jgi:hypothetical protein